MRRDGNIVDARYSFDYLSASTISIPIGPDQSHLGHVSMPVVIALRSIFARSMMSPHFGHMCALIHRFSRLIEGSQSNKSFIPFSYFVTIMVSFAIHWNDPKVASCLAVAKS